MQPNILKIIGPEQQRDQLKPLIDEWTSRAQRHVNIDESIRGVPGYQAPNEHVLHDAIVALLTGKNVLLKGPTGSGKTKLAQHLAWLFSHPLHQINCSVDLDAEAMLGFKTIVQREGESAIEFVSGPVIRAMNEGRFLYIDEINMARPETLPLINGVLDYRRMLTNPFTGDVVKAKEGFTVIAAINIGYVGTVPLNEALENRFVVIDVPYLQGEPLKKLLREQSRLQDESLFNQFVQLSADLVALVRMGHLSDDAASIRALIDACDLATFIPPLRAIQRAITDKLDDEREQAAVRNAAETLFE